MSDPTAEADLAVVGAGAAGLAAAIFAARRAPGRRILALDGARRLGAKILVSGGGRCNVTNASVGPADFASSDPRVVGHVLAAFRVEKARAFFSELGVALHEEERGKLFPDTGRARSLLDALLAEATRRGVGLLTGHRVVALTRHADGFRIETTQGVVAAKRVVLATGGMSLPKSGSDGGGYRLAEALGHTLVPPTPALVPLRLEGDFHAGLAGVAHEVELSVLVEGKRLARARGPLLWTHFGVSGPAALDVSRHWLRAQLEGRSPALLARMVPDADATALDQRLLELARERPRLALRGALATLLPNAVAAAVPPALQVEAAQPLGRLRREDRRRVAEALAAWPLPVRESLGWDRAEATAGGVPLAEVHSATLASRLCPGLHLAGEMLDVDGRLGGFNFQWAWASAWVAAQAAVW